MGGFRVGRGAASAVALAFLVAAAGGCGSGGSPSPAPSAADRSRAADTTVAWVEGSGRVAQVMVAPAGSPPRPVVLPSRLYDPGDLALSDSGHYLLVTGMPLDSSSEQDKREWLDDVATGKVTALPSSPVYQGFTGDSLYAVIANGHGGGTVMTLSPGTTVPKTVAFATPGGGDPSADDRAGSTSVVALEAGDQGVLTTDPPAGLGLAIHLVRPSGQASTVTASDPTGESLGFSDASQGMVTPDGRNVVLIGRGDAYEVDLTTGMSRALRLPGAPDPAGITGSRYTSRVRYVGLWTSGGQVEAAAEVVSNVECLTPASPPGCTLQPDQIDELQLSDGKWKSTGRHGFLSADDGALSVTASGPYQPFAGPKPTITRDGQVLSTGTLRVAVAGLATSPPATRT